MTEFRQMFKPASGLKRLSWSQRLHLDVPLLLSLLALLGYGSLILYSASDQNFAVFERQLLRIGLALVVMVTVAQIPVRLLKAATPWLFLGGVVLLVGVLVIGDIGKGAQRWLEFGFFRFQPSEIMKLAVPMAVAWYISTHPLPISFWRLCLAMLLMAIPMALILKQPDLGTALMIGASGLWVLFLAGMRWKIIFGALILIGSSLPILWRFMHAYQQRRVLTLLNPEQDPLGSGYHIIQSKIAIGSGGIFGKGWFNGTQSHLDFLPEHTTDFIFAVLGEEFGFIGCLVLIGLFLLVTYRGLAISFAAKDRFCRLLAGSLSLTFFVSAFVNIGMVAGILPVVGLPLPLVSYGGTSIVSMMASFGIIMAIHSFEKNA